jgi:hypothetical protein
MIKVGELRNFLKTNHFMDKGGFYIIVNIIKDDRKQCWDIIVYLSKYGMRFVYRYIFEDQNRELM